MLSPFLFSITNASDWEANPCSLNRFSLTALIDNLLLRARLLIVNIKVFQLLCQEEYKPINFNIYFQTSQLIHNILEVTYMLIHITFIFIYQIKKLSKKIVVCDVFLLYKFIDFIHNEYPFDS